MVSSNDGTVIDQQPRAGARMPRYTRVDLVLSATGFPAWLAVLALLSVGPALVAARILRHCAERRRWDGRIRVKPTSDPNPTPDPNPTLHLWEPDRAGSLTVRVEIHPDHGVQSVREVTRQ